MILIIGGGAAGLMAACQLARGGENARILEAQPRVGRKLLATGNGRCNFTNVNATVDNYFGSRKHAQKALEKCPPSEVIRIFDELGVPAYVDDEGRAYPASNMAASVLDALRFAIAEAKGEIISDFRAESIKCEHNKFVVTAQDGRSEHGDYAIIATGGLAAPKLGASGDFVNALGKIGHKVTKRLPAIAPLVCETQTIKGLKGQRVKGEITLFDGEKAIREESGEVLFTENGVSGICAMQLARSAQMCKNPRIAINMAPDMAKNDIFTRTEKLPLRECGEFLNGIVPRLVGVAVMRHAGIEDMKLAAGKLNAKQLNYIYNALTKFDIAVKGVGGFDAAQVTAGGLDMSAFSEDTLESRIVKNLYAVGEACDVDGDCGGFNLQWAFSSAIIAANDILRKRGKLK